MLDNHRLQVLVTNAATKFKSRVRAFLARHDGEIAQFKQQATAKTTELDRQLAQRYPARYPALKQQAGEAKIWYDQQIAEQQADPDRPSLVEQNDRRLADRMQDFGQSVSQTERKVRAKIAAKLRPEPPKS